MISDLGKYFLEIGCFYNLCIDKWIYMGIIWDMCTSVMNGQRETACVGFGKPRQTQGKCDGYQRAKRIKIMIKIKIMKRRMRV